MTVPELKKFASDACQVIEACQEFIGEQQAEIESLKSTLSKQASAPAPAPAPTPDPAPCKQELELDAEMLHKAACAMHSAYGNPSNVSVDQIEAAWKAKPSYMLNAITKLASACGAQQAASGTELGQPIMKKASAENAGQSADEAFMQKYV